MAHDARTALITGASSGIGAGFARRLAERGYNLILVARRADRLAELAEELQTRHGIEAEGLPADLATDEGIRRVEARIVDCDTLDLLVNNAGFGTTGRFAEIDLAPQLAMIHVHVIAPVRLIRAALPGMMARGAGGIINVSSVSAFWPNAGSATYSATKAYLNAFSEALAHELRGTGVTVQALCPGFTRTEFHDTEDVHGLRPQPDPGLPLADDPRGRSGLAGSAGTRADHRHSPSDLPGAGQPGSLGTRGLPAAPPRHRVAFPPRSKKGRPCRRSRPQVGSGDKCLNPGPSGC
ncbi:MAG: hypothetical protein KatS3mg043_0730 [Rhodothermaceae bacterium]|nr:MAG: hypothetical protein KatS3mg043_0730 [Rhodothermaceae bacterium]